MRSRPNSNPAASAPFWRGAIRRSTTARCGSSKPSRRTSTSTTTSSPASPRSRRSPPDIASRSTTLASRCSSPRDGSCATTGLSGSAVVMLDGDCSFRSCPPATRIWWGAYLGTPDEMLVAGTVGEVGEEIAEVRADARAPARLDHGHLPTAFGRLSRRGRITAWSFLLRAALTGFALWVVTLIVPGISFVGGDRRCRRSASSSSSR